MRSVRAMGVGVGVRVAVGVGVAAMVGVADGVGDAEAVAVGWAAARQLVRNTIPRQVNKNVLYMLRMDGIER